MLRSLEVRRVLSNYLRLLTTFALGIFVVRLLLVAGQEYFGFYSLITIGFGVGIMFKELARIALVPRLSDGLSQSDYEFEKRLSSAICISATLGAFGALVMWVLYLNIHRFSLPDQITQGAVVFVAYRAIQVFITVALAPFPILLLVKRHYVMANMFIVCERLIEFCAVLWAINFAVEHATELLPLMGFISLLFNALLLIGLVIWFYCHDSKFRISFGLVAWDEVTKLMSFFGLTAVLVLSANLFLRFDIALVNLKSGIIATAIFGITVQAIGMLRQLTEGLVGGLDAAFAFSKRQKNADDRIQSLVWLSSFLQASLALTAYAIILFAGKELVVLWLGQGRLDQKAISTTHSLIVIMGLGMIVRGLAQVWINALNGLGNIRLYVWWLLPGAFLNPILLIVIHSLKPELEVYFVAAILFTGLQVLTYGVVVPFVLARHLKIPIMRLYAPIALPMCCVAVAVCVWMLSKNWIESGSNQRIIVTTVLVFSAAAAVSLLWLRRNMNGKRT